MFFGLNFLTFISKSFKYLNWPCSSQTTDHDGNVYVIFTCGELPFCFSTYLQNIVLRFFFLLFFFVKTKGQVIVKIDKKTRKPAVWFAQKNPALRKMSYTGIELADENTLIVWNDNTHQFEVSQFKPDAFMFLRSKSDHWSF